jgi:bacterial leucyl aminopeptidase
MLLLPVCLFAAIALVRASVPTTPQEYADAGWRLILLHPDVPAIWMDPATVDSFSVQFQKDQWGYQDITANPVAAVPQLKVREDFNYPSDVYRRELVEELKSMSDPMNAWGYLTTLQSYNNRYYTAQSGVQSSQSINAQIQTWINQYGRGSYTTTILFNHSWPQQSIIATIYPSDRSVTETVVLGAHCDSTAPGMPTGRAPGANDDGSGTVTLMEAFRLLMEIGFVPDRILEFQWYAAEEVGLLGSDDIAETYARQNRQVYAMLQYDMNAYNPSGTATYRIMYDRQYMDEGLTDYLRILAEEYQDLPIITGSYGYAASDHASWARAGYPASHAKESTSYPQIHTANDLISNLDPDYMFEFLGPAIGFAVELTNGALPKRYE